MERGGLERLHAEVRRLIDGGSNPASAEAQSMADRYLQFCEAQFVNDPAPFAQLLSQYPNPERGDPEVRRAQWEFIARALEFRDTGERGRGGGCGGREGRGGAGGSGSPPGRETR
jgi:hypothetical protein